MLLKHIYISSNDISSSALFYIELLELDVLSATDREIELSNGIILCTREEYLSLTGTSNIEKNGSGIALEFEVQSFDKFLYKLYKYEYNLDYKIFLSNNKRTLSLSDPDHNTILIKECADSSKKIAYEEHSTQTIVHSYCEGIVFKEKE